MNRRKFLKLFLTLPGVLPAIGRAMPRPPILPDVPYPVEDCKLGINPECAEITQIQESPVSGFQYYKGHEIWRRLKTGDPLSLVREPDNPYDKNAVEIYWHGLKLGYLPRRENSVAAQMLGRGLPLRASITELRETDNPWGRIKVAVERGHG